MNQSTTKETEIVTLSDEDLNEKIQDLLDKNLDGDWIVESRLKPHNKEKEIFIYEKNRSSYDLGSEDFKKLWTKITSLVKRLDPKFYVAFQNWKEFVLRKAIA